MTDTTTRSDAPSRGQASGRGNGGAPRPGGAGRVPPSDLVAEQNLLGAMMLSKDAISATSTMLRPADFYKPAHAHIFDAILSLDSAGEPADPVTVADELARAGVLEAIGGRGLLAEIVSTAPAVSNAARYARIISDHAVLRKLIGVGGEIAELGYDVPDDVERAVDQAESLVYELGQRRVSDSMVPIESLLGDTLDRLEALVERGDAITGLPTGFVDLDRLLSGLQPNALIIVGARPAMGKTSFALNLTANAAFQSRRPVLFFSLEMGNLELTQRLLCAEAQIDSTKVRDGRLQDAEWDRIALGVSRLAEARLYLDDNPNVSVMEIRAKARRLKSQLGDLGLVVIDYLQLMQGRGRAESRQIEVSEMSRGLKILARELECPVIALSQLSRTLESRQDKRPMLSDLRESGSLEQDADVVMFLYRDEVYNPDSPDRGMAEILVSKHRNGPTGKINLAFRNHLTRFDNMAQL
ncbi:replicative DNA helicase [Acidimicrobiia bacterium EGI L10123]|uniref:replicative DNA helicase n=1 Tax=Salinilacustrithrix flava TaxID=2957203 RepID=UPI003D7C2634|nr:replicative DNA helicase [Acidimicrobiia bacterium EGI L10123]